MSHVPWFHQVLLKDFPFAPTVRPWLFYSHQLEPSVHIEFRHARAKNTELFNIAFYMLQVSAYFPPTTDCYLRSDAPSCDVNNVYVCETGNYSDSDMM